MRFYLMKCFVFCFLLVNHLLPAQGSNDSTATCSGSCCCSKDPAPVGIMISHVHEKGKWMLTYRYMGMAMKGNLSGAKPVDDNGVFTHYLMSPATMQMHMHMLMAMYGITSKITLMAMLNYIQQDMTMNMFPTGHTSHQHTHGTAGEKHSMSSQGLSDTRLYILWGLLNQARHQLILNAGLTLPTGSIHKTGNSDDPFYSAQRLPYAMQLGSGSWDFLPGITYLNQGGKFTFSSQLTSTIRFLYNDIGYRRGSEVCFNNWLAYYWLPFLSSSVRVEASALGKIAGSDETLYAQLEPSAHSYNYGGEMVYSYLGILFQSQRNCLKRHRLGVEAGLPLYQNVWGIQQAQQWTVNASWSFLF
jgi:hypothetical protein